MAVKISDLFAKPVSIPCGEGSIDVKALSLRALTTIMVNHRPAILHLIANSDGGKQLPPFGAVLEEFPDLFADVIAHAADAVGQEDDIKLLPVMVQVDCVKAIWKLTVPDPKALAALLFGVTAKLQKLSSDNAAKPENALILTDSNETSPNPSAS